jgi:tRNA A-37 threonylcarbamoyl transferase component Bud32
MASPIQVTAGGVRWEVAPECGDRLIGPDGLRLEEWLQSGQAQVIKTGAQRVVYRVALPGLSFYVKHNRLADLRAWLRQLVRPAKARIEYLRALAVAARRVPTVVPLALGERRSGVGPSDSFLITRSLDGAEPLNTFIDRELRALPPRRQARVRHRLARELGKLIARMHDAGIVHNDLHPGNLLIRLDADDRPALYLIDLHAVHLRRPLGWRASRENLILFNRWCVLRTGRADRLRFWRTYCRAREGAGWWNGGAAGSEQWAVGSKVAAGADAKASSANPEPASPSLPTFHRPLPTDEFALDLERRTWLSNYRFWRNRDQRCLVTNRYYRQVASPAAAGYAVSDLDPAVSRDLLADPDAPFTRPGVKLVKDSRSSTVAEFQVTVNGVTQAVIYKRFRLTQRSDPWLAWLRRPPVLRSWVYGHGLRERCLPTPRPLAVLYRGRFGMAREGYLLMEKIPDAQNLHEFLAMLAGLPADQRRSMLRQLIDQVARLVRQLHQCQLSHRDLKAANVLVTRGRPSAEARSRSAYVPAVPLDVWLIDLVGVVRYRKLRMRRKVQNLARLHASFCRESLLTRTDKLRFLRVYLLWALFGRQDWKDWWQRVQQATEAKISRNTRTGRPLS